jgi:hypothetical protein
MSAASTDVTEELSYSLLGGLGLWIGLFLKALPRGLPFAPKGPAAVESHRGWGHSPGVGWPRNSKTDLSRPGMNWIDEGSEGSESPQ